MNGLKIAVLSASKILELGLRAVLHDMDVEFSRDYAGVYTTCRNSKGNRIVVILTWPDATVLEKLTRAGIPVVILVPGSCRRAQSDLLIKKGAKGIVPMDLHDMEDLRTSIYIAAASSVFGVELPAEAVRRVTRRIREANTAFYELPESITPADQDIMAAVTGGFSNAEIARRLHLAEGTVRNRVSKLLNKLELRSRVQLALYSVERGIVWIDDLADSKPGRSDSSPG